jgi:methyl-accepting chemotaxis protein
MKLAKRLLVAPVIAASVALATGVLYGALMHQQSAASRTTFAAGVEDFKTAAQVQDQLGQLHTGVYRTLMTLNSLDEAKTKAYLDGVAKEIEGVQRIAAALAEGSDTEIKASVAKAAPLLQQYQKQLGQAVEVSSADINMGVAAMAAAEKTHAELSTAMRQVVNRVGARNEEQAEAAAEREKQLAIGLALLALFATAAALGWAWVGQRRLVAEIDRAVQLSEEVAKGNLGVDVSSQRRDEIGDLVRSLGSMVSQLRESMQTVKTAASSIGSASVEIASGNLDLSQRTEQTASSLQQTSGSMAQLTATVRQSADSASQANQLASSAAEVAQRGGNVVAQVVTTMEDINTSSRKIADIIGTIDGIAFQTNILALNAAVEAARAGEQGRGFAVVAGEVRNLAGRSAEAAREIKSLIGASVEKVESGSRLVKDAGSTMTEIVASVQRVSDIIGEISAAATEQSSGIGQVNTAINQLDQMTQQNAALVEESAAAAESLKGQAASLSAVVGRFDLGAGNAAPSKPERQAAAAPRPATVAQAVIAKAAVAPKPANAASVRVAAAAATPTPATQAAPGTAAKPAPAKAEAADDGDWASF